MIKFFVLAMALIGLTTPIVEAQHCAPITHSFLSELSLKPTKEGSLAIECEYFKSGGQTKERYQFYLIAYLQKNADKILTPLPEGTIAGPDEPLFDPKLAMVLETKLVDRNANGQYVYQFSINEKELGKRLAQDLMKDSEKKVEGGWSRIDGQVRLAIIVPFLENEKYANLEGVPQDRHECNYTGDRALLWQQLPWLLTVHFFEFENPQKELEQQVYLYFNGDERAKVSR